MREGGGLGPFVIAAIRLCAMSEASDLFLLFSPIPDPCQFRRLPSKNGWHTQLICNARELGSAAHCHQRARWSCVAGIVPSGVHLSRHINVPIVRKYLRPSPKDPSLEGPDNIFRIHCTVGLHMLHVLPTVLRVIRVVSWTSMVC